jgi:hypothetical protein
MPLSTRTRGNNRGTAEGVFIMFNIREFSEKLLNQFEIWLKSNEHNEHLRG